MKHATLLELSVTCSFYADGECPDFSIEPTDETARVLDNHRCILRSSPSGIRILSAIDSGSGDPFIPLSPSVALLFHLKLRNADFPLFADVTGVNAVTAPRFTSVGLTPEAAGELSLVSSGPRGAPGVFADVELYLSSQGLGPDAAKFHVAFQARSLRWAYYCVTNLSPSGDDLAIVDASPPGSPDVLLFSEANRTELGLQPDPSDPIATQLASRYPTMRRVRMISDAPVACSESPRKHIELRHGVDRLAGPLPNPSVRCAFRKAAPLPQDFLFHIVKYQADPFTNP